MLTSPLVSGKLSPHTVTTEQKTTKHIHKMRTKILLLTAAAFAVGIVASRADSPVYSANVVGYVNTVLQPGQFQMISNPLSNNVSNSAGTVLSGLVGGENVYIWNGSGYYSYGYLGAGNGTGAGGPSDWLDIGSPANIPGDVNVEGNMFAPAPIIAPGIGFFVQNGNASAETNTFTGTVVVTNSVTLFPGHYQMLASSIPIGGVTNSAYGLTNSLVGGENLYVWNGNGYYSYGYLGAGNGISAGGPSDWLDIGTPPNIPGDVNVEGNFFAPNPQINVGQGFFIQNGNASSEVWIQSINVNQ